MGQVKQWATSVAENRVGCIIDDYLKEKIDFNIAKDKITSLAHINDKIKEEYKRVFSTIKTPTKPSIIT